MAVYDTIDVHVLVELVFSVAFGGIMSCALVFNTLLPDNKCSLRTTLLFEVCACSVDDDLPGTQ